MLKLGTPSWVRTSDLRLRSPLLYPAELSGRVYSIANLTVYARCGVLESDCDGRVLCVDMRYCNDSICS